jgi:hypothetical protein
MKYPTSIHDPRIWVYSSWRLVVAATGLAF